MPDEAVTVTVPLPTAVTVPAETVATAVLLEVQVATCVMSKLPLHVFAVAVSEPVRLFAVRLRVERSKVIPVMHPTVTLTVCVPLMDGFWVEVAVIVVEPVPTAVTNPLVLIVATDVEELLQLTAGLPVLPSLKVPTALICTVLPVVPVSMVGVAGATVIELSVGLTKNPRQPAPKASRSKPAKARVSGSLRPVNIPLNIKASPRIA